MHSSCAHAVKCRTLAVQGGWDATWRPGAVGVLGSHGGCAACSACRGGGCGYGLSRLACCLSFRCPRSRVWLQSSPRLGYSRHSIVSPFVLPAYDAFHRGRPYFYRPFQASSACLVPAFDVLPTSLFPWAPSLHLVISACRSFSCFPFASPLAYRRPFFGR